ncbi:MAG: hypothetical protein BWZ07_02506 [Alphaproteobacteria bacterium ADurb.BinA280]|nr:MAG: hypothetical protein BWZ07_02506 [Alphaproteobacteria bacterium ADurb.BinA280]
MRLVALHFGQCNTKTLRAGTHCHGTAIGLHTARDLQPVVFNDIACRFALAGPLKLTQGQSLPGDQRHALGELIVVRQHIHLSSAADPDPRIADVLHVARIDSRSTGSLPHRATTALPT